MRSMRLMIPLAMLVFVVPAFAQDGAKQAAPETSTALELGAAAPKANVAMKGVNGKSLTIAQAAGKKGTLVLFTCNACPWVKGWEARISEVGNAAAKAGVGVIAINSNDPSKNPEDGFDEMKKRSTKLGLKFPYVVDATSEVAVAFGATRTPEAFLFDADGKLVYHGTIDDSPKDAAAVKDAYLKEAVNAVVTGQAVPMPLTKSLGCTIKFRKV